MKKRTQTPSDLWLSTKDAKLLAGIKTRTPLYSNGIKTSKLRGSKTNEVLWNRDDIVRIFKPTHPIELQSVPLTVVESVPKFEEHNAQQLFDEVVEKMGDRYNPIFDATIESLLRIQHSKRFYHAEVEKDPLSDYSKLLDQSIKQELSLIKGLQL